MSVDRSTAERGSAPEQSVPESLATSSPLAGDDVPSGPVAAPRTGDVGSITVDALESVMAGHWQAPDRDRLGDWLLRAAGGFTGRANSVLTVGDPGRPLPDALGAVRAWYADRGLPATASVIGPAGPPLPDPGAHRGLGHAFAADGWYVLDGAGALVLTSALEPLLACGPARLPDGLDLHRTAEPDAGWLDTYRYRGQELPANAVTLLLSAPAQVFCSIRDGAGTAAVARGSLGDGWVGVTAVEVDPRYRRRGLGRALLAAIAGWGADTGAEAAFLQVGDGNTGALSLYAGAGFAVHHRYDYLRAS